jgi:hypothetical protein
MSISGVGGGGSQVDPGASARHALGEALQNDASGNVSPADARRIIDAALGEIGAASNPERAFEAGKRAIAAAKTMANGAGAARTLATYEARGREAVAARLAALTGSAQLPLDVRDRFIALLRGQMVVSGRARVTITAVRGNERDGFEFEWKSGTKKGAGSAQPYGGTWFFAEKKVERSALDRATAEFRKYFDRDWAPELRDNGMSRAEIRAARDALLPDHALLPGEDDPLGFKDTYPLVLAFRNETGSDHGCYAGVNPTTGEVEVGTFN